MLTSTFAIGPTPLQDRPVSRTFLSRWISAAHGSSNADRTGLTDKGGLSAGKPPPVIRYHFVFHGEVSSVVETSREPSHLMLPMPTQPGSTRRTG